MIIYVGDANDVVRRIREHCSGNVEGSALRKAVARSRGYPLSVTRRQSGTKRIRIDSAKSSKGEDDISSYLASGTWAWVVCDSPMESRGFQWYAIDALKPVLNTDTRTWNQTARARYVSLLQQLEQCMPLRSSDLAGRTSGQGVYVFHHNQRP